MCELWHSYVLPQKRNFMEKKAMHVANSRITFNVARKMVLPVRVYLVEVCAHKFVIPALMHEQLEYRTTSFTLGLAC